MSTFLRTAERCAAFRVCASVVGIAISVASCAIHPVPEDVTGVPTYIIVRQIRCETRQAIIDSALGWLANDDRVDRDSRDIGVQFSNGSRKIQDFRPGLFKGEVASIIQLFFDTGVAYDFELQGTEVNNLDAEVDLAKPFIHSKFTLGIKGGLDRMRKNDRTFTITDKFSGLVGLPNTYCDGHDVQQTYNYNVPPNYLYPIAGKIGVVLLVQDFINLTLFANLSKKSTPQGPPTLVDALTFTTAISGTLTPTIVFSPVGTALNVTNATLTGVASRTDVHTVTMGLAIGGAGLKLLAPVRTTLFTTPLQRVTPTNASATLFTTPLLTASPASASEAAAVEAVNQFLTRKLFSPTINIGG
jgi:hypothetical protein